MGRIGTLWVPMDRTCYNLNPRKKKSITRSNLGRYPVCTSPVQGIGSSLRSSKSLATAGLNAAQCSINASISPYHRFQSAGSVERRRGSGECAIQ